MNIYQFMSDSPWLTFFLVFLFLTFLFKSWNRLMRHLNIRAQGWPPDHCDADGEFAEAEKEEA